MAHGGYAGGNKIASGNDDSPLNAKGEGAFPGSLALTGEAPARYGCNLLLQATCRIENHRRRVLGRGFGEIEHAHDGAGAVVGRAATDASQGPVFFDELNNRSLLGHRAVHEVLLFTG